MMTSLILVIDFSPIMPERCSLQQHIAFHAMPDNTVISKSMPRDICDYILIG
jgi:hypothetical protein